MAFYIKNLARAPITIFGSTLLPNARLDLTTVTTTAAIITSLLSGDLFKKITGRVLAIVDINDLLAIGATADQISSFSRIGYFQGRLGEEDFKDPFVFNSDGYLLTSATIGSVTVESQSEVEGRVLDGASAAGIKPVIIAGVDGSGNAQSLLTDVNGKLETTAATSSSWLPNYSTVAGDGYSTRASDTTITFTGPTITTPQLRTVIVDTGSAVNIYEQGKNSVRLSISGTTITVAGAGAAPIPAGCTVDVMWAGQEKAYDSSTQTLRNYPVIDLASRRVDTPVALIAAAQNFTNAWADLGPEIALSGYTRLTVWLTIDVNDGYNLRLRCLGKHTPGAGLEYVMPILKPDTTTAGAYVIYAEDEFIELTERVDQNMLFTWTIENTIPYVQIQVMAVTPGADPAQIDGAHVTYAWGA